MAAPSRAKLSLRVFKTARGQYGWIIWRGEDMVARSVEHYSRSDAARRSLRHVIKQIAPLVGVAIRTTKSKR